MEEHLNFEENYLVYQDIGTGNENKQISDNLSFICKGDKTKRIKAILR